MSDLHWNELDVMTLTSRKVIGEQISITGSAIILKVIKDYSLRQQEYEMLAVENVRNKLRLLKMQIHPRILFDCLQYIYKDIDTGTLHAPQMILQLSELLGYFLYESDLQQIPLSVEVKMMQNYIQIKKIGYGDKADIYVEISSEMNAKYVVPGLFLPLLETCCVRPKYSENLFVLILN